MARVMDRVSRPSYVFLCRRNGMGPQCGHSPRLSVRHAVLSTARKAEAHGLIISSPGNFSACELFHQHSITDDGGGGGRWGKGTANGVAGSPHPHTSLPQRGLAAQDGWPRRAFSHVPLPDPQPHRFRADCRQRPCTLSFASSLQCFDVL